VRVRDDTKGARQDLRSLRFFQVVRHTDLDKYYLKELIAKTILC